MCDPLTIGLALSAGGTLLETREANKNMARMQNAKNQAFAENMTRQRKYADESTQAFKTSTEEQGREDFDIKKEQEAKNIEDVFSGIRVQPEYNKNLVPSTPKNVVIAREKAGAEEAAKTDRNVKAGANLQGYGGALFGQDMARSDFARTFGNMQDKAYRDVSLMPLDIQSAQNNAYRAPGAFPQLMKMAGTGLSFASAGGMFDKPFWTFGGTPHTMSAGGVPIPGTKPTVIKNLFG